MRGTIRRLTIFHLIGCFSFVAYRKEKSEFPWLITPYKHAHLTLEQRQIYLNAYFETMGFILYGYLPRKDSSAMKQLNAWIDCVMETKDSKKWSPDLGWIFGENLDKSAAYILYNEVSPRICEGYTEKAGTQVRTLKIYSYDDWEKWSLKDKAVYLSGYIDTVASAQTSRPSQQVNPAAPCCELARDKEEPSLSREAKAREGVKNPDAQPRRTLRRRGNGMLGQDTVAQGRPQAVSGPQPL
jgi:hypothetical protein